MRGVVTRFHPLSHFLLLHCSHFCWFSQVYHLHFVQYSPDPLMCQMNILPYVCFAHHELCLHFTAYGAGTILALLRVTLNINHRSFKLTSCCSFSVSPGPPGSCSLRALPVLENSPKDARASFLAVRCSVWVADMLCCLAVL